MTKLQFLKPIMQIQEKENSNSNCSIFMIQCLSSTYGNTLGTPLRRILLSSLPGIAIVNVKIEGVKHEFSFIEGITEDVMTILLNLKGVILSSDYDSIEDFEQKLEIDVKGPKEVTASDFKPVTGIKIINPSHVIATLSSNAKLKMEVTVRRGIGYKGSEENKIYNRGEFGVIAIDSIYTPIIRSTFHVESKLGNKEELILEIETNGAITPKKALALAAKILLDHLAVLVELSEETQKINFIQEPEKSHHNHALDFKIEQLELSVRLLNSLKKSKIFTVRELVSHQEEEITKLSSLGKKSFEELKEKMKNLDLHFGMLNKLE
ncbi:MAG: DNA-directed RNA polymerase subunit alpha ['Waltheria sp.' little leaf phytoplasma]|nr:DNA-directed RNA polymerase subunit alpha ['Waltheria sp.' little leaf phytoplasma]